MLEEAAARVWNADPATCHVQNHAVVHEPTGRRLGFGELVEVAADLPLPSSDHMQLRFKPANARRYVGKPVPIVDLADIVRGRATYGIDVVVPGMKHVSIERCPVYGGRARSFRIAWIRTSFHCRATECAASAGGATRMSKRAGAKRSLESMRHTPHGSREGLAGGR